MTIPHTSRLRFSAAFARLLATFVFSLLVSITVHAAAPHRTHSSQVACRVQVSTQHQPLQEERWREQEIQRYKPGGSTDVMTEKSDDYVKLILIPLLLFILAIAVLRLQSF